MVYGLNELRKDSSPLYDCGYFKAGSNAILFEELKKNVQILRPQYIPLIEAMRTPDYLLNSAIGNKYGDIYQ